MRGFIPSLTIALGLAACTSTGVKPPSLQPRAGEEVDPRIPVERPVNDRPASPALLSRLNALVEQARAGEPAFAKAIEAARLAANVAGAPQSEGWIAAQVALSAAIEARGPAAYALGSIDSLGATMLAEQGGLAPNDQKAIDEAAETVGAIDKGQAAAIDALKVRLGS